MKLDTIARFWNKVDRDGPIPSDPWAPINNECWLWTGAKSTGGYGQLGINGTVYYAHRLAYTWFVAPIPDGMQIDHLCRVRNCVRPDHLDVVTNRENARRGRPARYWSSRTHCIHGHPFDEENTRVTDRQRVCRTCERAKARRYQRRKRDMV